MLRLVGFYRVSVCLTAYCSLWASYTGYTGWWFLACLVVWLVSGIGKSWTCLAGGWGSSTHSFTDCVPIRAGLYLAGCCGGWGYINYGCFSIWYLLFERLFSTGYGPFRWVRSAVQSVLVAVLRLWGCLVGLYFGWFRWCSLGLSVWLFFDGASRVHS